MMKAASLLLALVSLAGCASNSGAQKIGPDTYTVTASRHNMAGGAAGAQSSALQEANRQCAALGREVMVSSTNAGFQRPHNHYTVTFRCLAPNDPSLRQPQIEQRPDIVIEDRRK